MITIIHGIIGGGKTVHAVDRAVQYLANGGIVATNIFLKWDKVKEYVHKNHGVTVLDEQFYELKPEHFLDFYERIPRGRPGQPVLCILDECATAYDVRSGSREFKQLQHLYNFFRQSRKVSIDVIMIVQNMNDLNSKIRDLAAFNYQYRDMLSFIIPVLKLHWPFDQFRETKYDKASNVQVGRTYHPKKPGLFDLYETEQLYTEFTTLQAVELDFEAAQKKKVKGKKKMHPAGYVIMIIQTLMLIGMMMKPSASPDLVSTSLDMPNIENIGSETNDQQQAISNPIDYEFEHLIYYETKRRGEQVSVNGLAYWPGRLTEHGLCLAVSRDHVHLRRQDGTEKYILHAENKEVKFPSSFKTPSSIEVSRTPEHVPLIVSSPES